MDQLDGRVAVITGGSGGIGRAAAKRFVEEGAKVLIVDLDERALRSAVDAIGRNQISSITADVTSDDDTQRYVGDYIIIGKELQIRRALSRTHLYSSAFVVDKESGRFVLRGAGWGNGVGLCQIGAAAMANEGKTYKEILQHYCRGTTVSA